MSKEYINALRKKRKLVRNIQKLRYARSMTNNNNNNTREILNRKMRALITQNHRLEEQLYILGLQAGLTNNNKKKLGKLSHLVSVQSIARRTLQKRRNRNAQRAAARRSFVTGAHHTLPRSYFPPSTVRRPITRMPNRVTRSVTSLTRSLM